MATASTVTINAFSVEVVATSSVTRTFYKTSDLLFIYRSSTDAFEIQYKQTRAKMWGGDLDSVTVTGQSTTTAAAKFTVLRLYMLETTTTTGYRSFIGRDNIKFIYKTSTNRLDIQDARNSQPLWFGNSDSLHVTGVTGATAKLAWLRTVVNRTFETGILSGGRPATVAVGAAAGSGATVTCTDCNEVTGLVTLTTGTTALNSGVLFTLTFPNTAPNGARVIIQPNNTIAVTHALRVLGSETTTTGVQNAITTALTDATAYTYKYIRVSY